jgi:hypothetical protein
MRYTIMRANLIAVLLVLAGWAWSLALGALLKLVR